MYCILNKCVRAGLTPCAIYVRVRLCILCGPNYTIMLLCVRITEHTHIIWFTHGLLITTISHSMSLLYGFFVAFSWSLLYFTLAVMRPRPLCSFSRPDEFFVYSNIMRYDRLTNDHYGLAVIHENEWVKNCERAHAHGKR